MDRGNRFNFMYARNRMLALYALSSHTRMMWKVSAIFVYSIVLGEKHEFQFETSGFFYLYLKTKKSKEEKLYYHFSIQ